MRTLLTRALIALATAGALVAVPACKHRDPAVNPAQVWGIDVISTVEPNGPALVLEGHRLSIRITVVATLCGPEAFEEMDARGVTYGHLCRALLTESDVAAEAAKHPELQIQERTATAHVKVVYEYGAEELHTPVEYDLEPMAMGARNDLTPSWNVRLDRPPPADAGPKPENGPHRVHAMISNCRLDNHSACASNGRRFFTRDINIGSSSQALTVPERTGSLVRQELRTATPGSNEQPGQAGPNGPIGGVPVSRAVSGVFRAGSGLGRVSFWGAEFATPQAPGAVEQAGPTVIEEAFGRAGLAGGAGFAPAAEMRRHDAGPLGGQVWCQTFEYQVLKTTTFYACGWMDRSTVGTIVINDYAADHLKLNEARAAALLVSMRKDIEKAS